MYFTLRIEKTRIIEDHIANYVIMIYDMCIFSFIKYFS